ncbi:MAG: cupin domain-containing protein [Alphaproteobacteria bacterium]|nr:cupin domain-containing protein [Alphaproteobacteria bacterium]
MSPDRAPQVAYWHLWTDEGGVSRQTRCTIEHFELKSMNPPAGPQWQGERIRGPMTLLITVQPVGWVGDWHENPKPQWIVPLSGRWFVESMDGERVEMGPGEISFGGDQNTRPLDGRKGHLSGTVGAEPAVLLVVQLDGPPPPAPCPLR